MDSASMARSAGRSSSAAARATAVLVQSTHAAELLRETTGFASADVGPHPCWNDGEAGHIDDGEPPWVVSAGIAHEAKQTDRFAAAARRLVSDGTARAAIVGDGAGRFVTDGDGIVAAGHVDAAEFDRWLRRASVLVQLRAGSNGESSGVVAHGLARGVPLVVTDIGAMSELPDEAIDAFIAAYRPIDASFEPGGAEADDPVTPVSPPAPWAASWAGIARLLRGRAPRASSPGCSARPPARPRSRRT